MSMAMEEEPWPEPVAIKVFGWLLFGVGNVETEEDDEE
jgi:hypothetical protein